MQDPPQDAAAAASPERVAELERLEKIRARVSGQLAVAEKAIAAAGSAPEAAKLAEARLTLMVALVRVDRAIAELQASEPPRLRTRIGSLQDVVREAAASVRRTRDAQLPADSPSAAPEPEPAEAPPPGDELQGQTTDGRELGGKGRPRKSAPPARCAPGDPLCLSAGEAEADDWDALDEGGSGEKKKEEKAGGPFRYERRGSGGGQGGGRKAATVAADEQRVDLSPVLQRSFGALLGCLTPERQERGVRLQVTLRLAPDGSFREPRLQTSDPLEPASKSCLAGVLRGLRLPDYDGPSRLITVPLWLSGD